ncbi:RagB/SusD family nutrient uptake outer membrane protein [Carboxylicivirga sp. N1Y90]|uniref:RagB/SusD family nutrient uptake outer membrane protein n=1 Tax=Carboxylicivirga fragile TaxID=3417571 RepID=UPI003D3317F4|nr:RagB/SusD family nutrient uptake outer membrane protein [Marinilabiliaceae bacterium N1Y90]
MKKIFVYIFLLAGIFTACEDDLNVKPIDPNLVFGDEVYSTLEGYKQVLAKIYGSYNVSGQYGDDNESDLSTIEDGGMSAYLRNYWNFQTLPTGEAMNAWNDGGLVAIQNGVWSADNQFVAGMFYRLYYMISLTNEFLRESSGGSVVDANPEAIKQMRAEAKLVRAIAYYHGIDLFGKMAIIEENSSEAYPTPTPRPELFSWIVSQLEDEIIPDLPAAATASYGQMDAGTAYMVLAKMYINAVNFSGVENPVQGKSSYDEVVKYTEMVNAAYSLESNYRKLFSTDNDAAEGIIFGLALDASKTQGFSASQYIMSAGTNGALSNHVGIPSSAWGGNHATRSVYDKFTMRPGGDVRGATQNIEETLDHTTTMVINAGLDMDNPLDYTQGVNVTKFKNRTSAGADGSDPYFVDTDFPMFRLADSYLMYAEAVVRGGNGTMAKAVEYVNDVIERGYGDDNNNIIEAELTLDFLLEERGREFYWEGYRRQDLIRFGKFTSGDYLWQWKGGVQDGRALDAHRNVYPIPSSELAANPNAEQNDNY